jgi:cobalamin biosynthesis Mg chelatase CobN
MREGSERFGEWSEAAGAPSVPAATNGARTNGHSNGHPSDSRRDARCTDRAPVDEEREAALLGLMAALESGELDSYEYTSRVRRVERATTRAELAAATERDGAQSGASAYVCTPDPVDIATMAAASRRSAKSPVTNRYVALAIVVLLFVMLLTVGIWLEGRIRSSGTSPGAAPSGHSSLSAPPPSPLSPRR